jgi:hypothetical protein
MARRTKPLREAPGIYTKGFLTYFSAWVHGGSWIKGDMYSTAWLHCGTTEVIDGEAYLFLAVNAETRDVKEPAVVDLWVDSYADDHSYDESEEYALRLSRIWHYEAYRFSHWQDNGLLRKKTAVYEFVRAFALTPTPGTRHWKLVQGAEITVPGQGSSLPVAKDRWNALADEVDAICATFCQITNLVPPGTVEDKLAGPRVAVEHCRGEAHRLAALGYHLESLPACKETVAGLKAAESQLLSTRRAALGAVELATGIVIEVGQAFPDDARINGEVDLAALAGAVSELAERTIKS